MNRRHTKTMSFLLALILCTINSCKEDNITNDIPLAEKQITFTPKTHSLDNNDNFSTDGKYLCYDTRGMVFNSNLANCKSIEKVEIATGRETVLWEPESVSGKNGAPGVAAVSYHPTDNKVIFIHGPLLEEVDEKGYYDIRNRTAVIVSADGLGVLTKVDMRDASDEGPTILGAQRGGTHRHEFSRDGKRIGFTYDDFLKQDYDRTIGYMEAHENAPEGYTNYFAVLLKPANKGSSKPGEIEKAYGDSWVDYEGTKRAFIGKVRAANAIDYETSLFVAEIPNTTEITTSDSGDKDTYPLPPKGIKIRRLTHSTSDEGIVRGSYDGERIAYLSDDENGIKQVFVIPTEGIDTHKNLEKRPKKVTNYKSDASNIRWHVFDNWVFSISDGKVYASNVGNSTDFGKTYLLTPEGLERTNLVASPQGSMLAYNVNLVDKDSERIIDGEIQNEVAQIFILELNDDYLKQLLN
jgi:hypothetical protein